MTTEEDEDDNSPSDYVEEICILDAVVCVHFVGANLQRILTRSLEAAGLVLLVPQEVCDEIAGKDRKYPGLAQRWARLEASQFIRVLPRLTAVDAPARVVEVIEQIRGLEFEQAVRRRRDLGEVVVISHAVHLSEQGHHVIALIDDQEGQHLASRWGLEVLTIEDVLAIAINLGLFPTVGRLREVYEKLRAYGDGLVPFPKSGLGEHHDLWFHRANT